MSRVHAAILRRRRAAVARHPERQRRLSRPVVSIGNLAVGGSGKTPLVRAIAAQLVEAGERPSILSRGYARQDPADGVVVVRDPHGLRADLPRSGDEPLMLARQLPGVAVLVSPDRYLAGRLAEHHFGCTVHLLDDGFQHLALHRDVDLVIVTLEDVENPRLVPFGRLREPLEALGSADAVVVAEDIAALSSAPGRPIWSMIRRVEAARLVEPFGEPVAPGAPAFALAGIARPARFFDDLRRSGWTVVGEMTFRDHHPYSSDDVTRIVQKARASGAELVLTTEKDLMRLLPLRPFPVAFAWVPLSVTLERAVEFEGWLAAKLGRRREHAA